MSSYRREVYSSSSPQGTKGAPYSITSNPACVSPQNGFEVVWKKFWSSLASVCSFLNSTGLRECDLSPAISAASAHLGPKRIARTVYCRKQKTRKKKTTFCWHLGVIWYMWEVNPYRCWCNPTVSVLAFHIPFPKNTPQLSGVASENRSRFAWSNPSTITPQESSLASVYVPLSHRSKPCRRQPSGYGKHDLTEGSMFFQFSDWFQLHAETKSSSDFSNRTKTAISLGEDETWLVCS